VAVVGGGITGVTAARLLKREGKTVALLEARKIGLGVTGFTTAKLTVGHGLIYSTLVPRYGADRARLYAESNQAGIERIAAFVEEDRIACDFERAANVVFGRAASDLPKLHEEVACARRAGVDARFTTETELPFDVAGGIEIPDQAQFHPRRYLLALAEALPGDGSHVFELTRAEQVRERDRRCSVRTTSGVVHARDVVVATHLPLLDRGLFFAKAHPAMSYAIAAPVDDDRAPRNMYISAGPPTRSIRSAPSDEGGRMLIVGGEGHRPGAGGDTERHYQALEEFLDEQFGAAPVEHRWSAHDYVPVDGLPYIGRLTRGSRHVYVATGFAKWGLAKGTCAAMLIGDLILGRPNPWGELYDASRLGTARSATRLLTENTQVAMHFVAARVKPRPGREALERLQAGEGAVVRVGRRRVAAYRDGEGTLHTLSATCTHLVCGVEWNTAERTWDCPCHGSRFGATGDVIEGPATAPLPRVTLRS
jgi:glycine/D-amino acid oxidase-like deaminating enzyme/nitrite reductase/ring-hydroxylating ferredoxin subunit